MIFVVVSTGHFDPLIETCDKLRDKYEFVGQIGSGLYVPQFPHFRTGTPKEIETQMEKAELVISHGGTGMLSMLYQLKKKAVVIPKQVRYGEPNDSQVELSEKWAELGMAVLCMDVNDLAFSIEQCRVTEFQYVNFPKLGVQLNRDLNPIAPPASQVADSFSP